jgi:hypothetical protein
MRSDIESLLRDAASDSQPVVGLASPVELRRRGDRRRVAQRGATVVTTMAAVVGGVAIAVGNLPLGWSGPSLGPATPGHVTSSVPRTPSPDRSSGLAEISFCVGTSARHKAGQTVRVTVIRGSQVLAEPTITVPMWTSVHVSPGPFSVLVDGTRTMWATVGAGETSSGTDGGDCPNH